MGGMNISNFRQKVLEQKELVTEKEFFTSESCREYLQNLAEAINKKFNNEINLHIEWGNPNDYIAYASDRFELKVNVNNSFFNASKTKVDKLVMLKGLVLHECGHLLFTDFHLRNNARKVMTEKRILFPAPSCEEYYEWRTDMITLSEHEMQQWVTLWNLLRNSIEDGFIEQMILQTIPGEGQCLYPLRNMQKEDFDSIKVQKNNGLDTAVILFNSILSLAKYSTVKMDPDDKDEPAIKALLDNYDLIMNAVAEQKSFNRMKLVNTLFCKIYKFLKEEENREKSNDKKQNNPDKQSGNESDGQQDSDSDSQSNDESDGQQDSESDSQSDDDSDGQQGSEPDSQSDNNSDGQQDSDSDSQSDDETGSTSKIPSPDDILNNIPDMNNINDNIDTNSGSVLNDSNINSQMEQDNKVNGSIQEKLDNIMNQEEPQAEIPAPGDERQADYIDETIAEEKVKADEENELAESLKTEAKEMDYGPINKNTRCTLRREEPTPHAYETYQNDMKDIGFLVNKLVKEIKNKIKDQQQGGKLNGLYQGRYLDQHSLYRYDLRMLCRNDLPEDIPDMAIGILIDNSGSMSRDRKIENARKTALLLYEFGLELNIPVMVYGHNSVHNVTLHALADYGSVDNKDRYRICDMSANGCNRDGMALRFCSEKLSQRHEQNKIMFIISDGLPSDYSSYVEAAADIRNVLMDYGKKGVKYITVGLGTDQKRIEELYCNNLTSRTSARFLKTDDAADIPVLTVRLIKDLIKSK